MSCIATEMFSFLINITFSTGLKKTALPEYSSLPCIIQIVIIDFIFISAFNSYLIFEMVLRLNWMQNSEIKLVVCVVTSMNWIMSSQIQVRTKS